MLDVGFSEILLTSAIALIVLGPERLPKVARQVGNWMGRARAMARQLSEQLEREVSAEEFLKTQSKPGSTVHLPAGEAPLPNSVASDPAYTQTIAPPPAPASEPGIAAHGSAPTTLSDSGPEARTSEPTYGLAASATTAAAMHAADGHASDPHVAAPHPPHE